MQSLDTKFCFDLTEKQKARRSFSSITTTFLKCYQSDILFALYFIKFTCDLSFQLGRHNMRRNHIICNFYLEYCYHIFY